jgi:hypothetical protein
MGMVDRGFKLMLCQAIDYNIGIFCFSLLKHSTKRSKSKDWLTLNQDDIDFDLIFGVLMPLSAIFQLYHGDQF